MKKKIGVVIAVLLYAAIAVGIAVCIKMGGNYPTGADTMCHVYKGDSLYQSIGQGDIYPLYDRFWYMCWRCARCLWEEVRCRDTFCMWL